jgi:hypothetical protein
VSGKAFKAKCLLLNDEEKKFLLPDQSVREESESVSLRFPDSRGI